ncbi:MAG TPA: C39 family peptidase [Thermodesulfovibrionales bacterium]|nr:C39 family peptidase [Thermodesulfovibrionales bacterium]
MAPKSALFVSALLGVLTSACSTASRMPEARQQINLHVIQNVPFFPQEEYQCGPASLASVLNYHGVLVTPDEVAGAIYSPSARGTLDIDMVLYAQSRGLWASQYRGGLGDLKDKIDADQPLIVLVDYGFSVFQVNHFMVVIGYSDEGVVVHSGQHEKKFIPMEDFMKSWEKSNYWTLLITRKS